MLKGGDRDGGGSVCGVCGVAHLDAGPTELRVDQPAGAHLASGPRELRVDQPAGAHLASGPRERRINQLAWLCLASSQWAAVWPCVPGSN